jgi:hypothetical protein
MRGIEQVVFERNQLSEIYFILGQLLDNLELGFFKILPLN